MYTYAVQYDCEKVFHDPANNHTYIFLEERALLVLFSFTLHKTYRTRNVRQQPYSSVGIFSHICFCERICVCVREKAL